MALCGLDWSGPVESSCGRGNEPSGPIKCWVASRVSSQLTLFCADSHRDISVNHVSEVSGICDSRISAAVAQSV
jgi:hypothetical protein